MHTNEKVIEECNELIKYDLDAVGAYKEAIDDVKEPSIRAQLEQFQADHERHVTELSAVVRRLGGEPPEMPHVKGAVRKMLTKAAGLGGTEAVLKAMRSNEEVLNETYAHHASQEFPADVLELIRRNYSDEQRHLAWVETALQNRIWESGQPGASP